MGDAKKDAVIFEAVALTNICGTTFAVYRNGDGRAYFRRREVVDALGRVFTKNPEEWEKYSRYGVARVPARFIDYDWVKRCGSHYCPRLETGEVEPFLTFEGLYRAFAASRSHFGEKARRRFLKLQDESDLKSLAQAALKLLDEREAEIKRLTAQERARRLTKSPKNRAKSTQGGRRRVRSAP